MSQLNHKTLRWLLLLDVLSVQGRPLSCAEILDKLKERQDGRAVTVRTVQRDINEMERSGLLAFERVDRSGTPTYRIDASFAGPMQRLGLTMSPHTAMAMKLALKHARPLLPPSAQGALDEQEERADRVLAWSGRPGVVPWLGKVRMLAAGHLLHPPTIDAALLAVIYSSLASDTKLRARYKPLDRAESEFREYTLLGLVSRPPRLYVVASAAHRAEPHILNVSRLRGAESLLTRSERPPDFDLDEYLSAHPIDLPSPGDPVTLRMSVTEDVAGQLTETPIGLHQVVESGPRWVVEAEVLDTQALRSYLLSWGGKIEVLAPARLRAALKAEVDALHKSYRRVL